MRSEWHRIAGSLTAGLLGRQYSVMSIGGFYLLVAMVGTANGGLMVLLTPLLQRWVQVNHRTLCAALFCVFPDFTLSLSLFALL
eukprot:COSAG06_NODE_360_length_16832_cov_9.250209_16_plen_84_part_00